MNDVVEAFMVEVLKLADVAVRYMAIAGTWSVTYNDWSVRQNVACIQEFGTRRMHAVELIQQALNVQTPTVRDPHPEKDGVYVVNKEETLAAREKLGMLKDRFAAWAYEYAPRRQRLCRIYNDLFNTLRQREFDRSHLKLPGFSQCYDLHRSQRNAIWRIVQSGNTGLFHAVGASKTQAFVELLVDFIDSQVKNTFHGNRHAFIAPAALTIFVWVLLLSVMDLLPIDIMAWVYEHVFGLHNCRCVPTTDVNTTFALALSIWFLTIFFSIKVKGLGGWMHELFCTPFGTNIILWPLNLLFNMIEYISKPLSHSLRLFGNIYAGEIIFLLLGMWAATGVSGAFFSAVLGAGWAIFHILIVSLQAFIFMMLTVVYLAMAHESH